VPLLLFLLAIVYYYSTTLLLVVELAVECVVQGVVIKIQAILYGLELIH